MQNIKEIIRPAIFLFVFLMISHDGVFAETIQLKTDKVISGEILEENDEFLEVDVGHDIRIRLYQDEIESIIEDEIVGTDPEDQVDEGSNFLWEINSGGNTAYLFGSIHLGKADMYPLDPTVEEAFDRSAVLVVEIDVDALDPMVVQQTMAMKGSYLDGNRLENHLEADVVIRLSAQLEKYGMSIEHLSQFKPWFAAITLTVLQIKDLGFDEDYGVDRYFLKNARGRKAILELESLESQLSFLDSLENQELFLEYTLDSMDEIQKMLDQLVGAWKDGNAEMMEKIMITDILEHNPQAEPILKTILFDRNVTMAEEIKEYLQSGDVHFVVVGAGHLIGEKGIVELLRDENFKVTQL